MKYWEDRLTLDQVKAVNAAIRSSRTQSRTSASQHKLYDTLTACGLTPEEADAMIDLE